MSNILVMMRIRRRTVVIKTVMVVMMMVFVGGAHVRLSLSTTYYKNCFNFNSFVNLYWYFTRYVLSSTVISICIYFDIGIGMKVCRWWYSRVQETVIQSRCGGVTKIASRWGGGGAGHTLVVPSDITNMFEPRQMVVYYVSRGSLPYIGGRFVHFSHFMVNLSLKFLFELAKITRMLN